MNQPYRRVLLFEIENHFAIRNLENMLIKALPGLKRCKCDGKFVSIYEIPLFDFYTTHSNIEEIKCFFNWFKSINAWNIYNTIVIFYDSNVPINLFKDLLNYLVDKYTFYDFIVNSYVGLKDIENILKQRENLNILYNKQFIINIEEEYKLKNNVILVKKEETVDLK